MTISMWMICWRVLTQLVKPVVSSMMLLLWWNRPVCHLLSGYPTVQRGLMYYRERVSGQVFAGCIHQSTGNQVVGSTWCLLFQCCFSTRRCVCDQEDRAQLFLPAVWPIGLHCSLCDVGKVFISRVMVPWSTVGWRAARGVQDLVLAMGRWTWDFAEMDHSEELYRCGLDWSQELSASWVWRCFH